MITPSRADQVGPRLGRQAERLQLGPDPLADFVVDVDLLVDEVGLRFVLVGDLLGDVDDRAADAALAEGGGGEDEDDRLLAEDFGEVDLVHLVGRHAGVDLFQVVADVGGGQRLDLRRAFADLRHLGVFADDGEGTRRRFELAARRP